MIPEIDGNPAFAHTVYSTYFLGNYFEESHGLTNLEYSCCAGVWVECTGLLRP